jgi:hypothetical protein
LTLPAEFNFGFPTADAPPNDDAPSGTVSFSCGISLNRQSLKKNKEISKYYF